MAGLIDTAHFPHNINPSQSQPVATNGPRRLIVSGWSQATSRHSCGAVTGPFWDLRNPVLAQKGKYASIGSKRKTCLLNSL